MFFGDRAEAETLLLYRPHGGCGPAPAWIYTSRLLAGSRSQTGLEPVLVDTAYHVESRGLASHMI